MAAGLTYAQALKRGTKAEMREHPWATKEEAEQIARDHLTEDPHYYGKRKGLSRVTVIRGRRV